MAWTGFEGVLSFEHDKVPNDEIIKVMHDLILFQPTSFRSNLKNFKRLGKNNFWEQVRLNLEQENAFCSYAKRFLQNPIRLDSVYISYFPTTNIIQFRFCLETEDMNVLRKLETVISRFSQKYTILSASIRTIGEYNWNDNKDLELQQKNHKEIPEIKTIQIACVDYADVRQFSGHTNEYEGLWFGCSYEMWFGKDYDKYIPLCKIADFQECESNSIYDNGTVHIVMFKNPYDFSDVHCMEKAYMFRKATGCDVTFDFWQDKLSKLSYEQGEFNVEIESGAFPHGGVRLIKTYLDVNGKPTTKSQAVKIHISERGTDGRAVYEVITEI